MTRRRKPPQVKGTICLDFDGVLSQGAGYHWPLTGLNLDLIHEAHARGYAVVIMTCNDVRRVAAELERHGVWALGDESMARQYWTAPDVVLVTGRKVVADLYVDDRAVHYEYGQPASVVWDALESPVAV